MDNITERIARHADIDTRRAMGILPRKLVLPELNLAINSEDYTEFNRDRCRYVRLNNAQVYISPDEISWLFGADDFMTSRSYSFRRNDGRVCFHAMLMRHPDLNEDGTLRTWQSL